MTSYHSKDYSIEIHATKVWLGGMVNDGSLCFLQGKD